MLTVVGFAALDTIRTPTRTVSETLGGAAVFAGVSASFFARTGLVGVVGEDFPRAYSETLSRYLSIEGLSTRRGKTFRFDCRYDESMSSRETIKVDLNVVVGFEPRIPESYMKSKFLYLTTNDPEKSVALLRELEGIKLSMSDTIDYWIRTKREEVKKMVGLVDIMMINDEEARMLTKEHNLVACARKMMEWGARYVVIKKGEHGAIMFHQDMIFPMTGFPLERVVDPTGAGDSFAGAMMGYLAGKNSVSLNSIRKAMVFGNVMGSFSVEGYGLDGLLHLKKSHITRRAKTYERMISVQ